MKQILKWFLMLNKRLYKKATFIIILALIPICVAAFSYISKQDSGFIHIALAATDESDAVTNEVIGELIESSSIIRFYKAESPLAARDDVETGGADEAWIFPANMQQSVNEFIAGGNNKEFITIVVREQNMVLRLSHEKLTATLYKYCAKAKYIDFARTNVSKLDHLSDEELMEYFNGVNMSEDLFVYGNPSISLEGEEPENYLISPIRGMLGILVTICGMAAAMYYMKDEKIGTFSLIRQSRRIYVAFFCILIAVLNVAAVVLISLAISGLATSILKELLILLLFCLCVSAFTLLLKEIICGIAVYGSIIPMLTVVMLVICPVFVDLRWMYLLQMFFPPTYYINAVYDDRYLLYMLEYFAIVSLLCLIIDRVKRIRRS